MRGCERKRELRGSRRYQRYLHETGRKDAKERKLEARKEGRNPAIFQRSVRYEGSAQLRSCHLRAALECKKKDCEPPQPPHTNRLHPHCGTSIRDRLDHEPQCSVVSSHAPVLGLIILVLVLVHPPSSPGPRPMPCAYSGQRSRFRPRSLSRLAADSHGSTCCRRRRRLDGNGLHSSMVPPDLNSLF